MRRALIRANQVQGIASIFKLLNLATNRPLLIPYQNGKERMGCVPPVIVAPLSPVGVV